MFHISCTSFVDVLKKCYWKNTDCIHFSCVTPDEVSCCIFITVVRYMA